MNNEFKCSFYNICVKNGSNKYIIYNTLYNSLAKLNELEYKMLIDLNFKDTELTNMFIKNGFWVKSNINEFNNYIKITRISRKLKSDNYCITILTTTRCNARCFYCFESNFAQRTMTDECAERIVKFLSKIASDKICIRWFGGEPLMNLKHIDFISREIKKSNLELEASIVTNGYLFNNKIIHKAFYDWNIRYVQITLDGAYEEYNKRKNYIDNKTNAFEIVLQNIEMLLELGITVNIRLNIDGYNIDNICLLLEILLLKFNKYQNCLIYPAFLFGCENSIINENEIKKILIKLLNTSRNVSGITYNNFIYIFNTILNSYPRIQSCMKDSLYSFVINEGGYIFYCDQEINEKNESCYSVFEENAIFRNKPIFDTDLPAECIECTFLPKCYGGCQSERNKGRTPCVAIPSAVNSILSII